MNKDINLVSEKNKTTLKHNRIVKSIKFFAICFISVVLLFAIIIFFLNLRISIPNIKKDQESALHGISSLSKKSANLFIVNDRLRGINNILKERKDYSLTLSSILKNIPDGVNPTLLEVDEDDFVITVSSNSLNKIDEFFNNMYKTSAEKTFISDLKIGGLSVNQKNGLYSLTLKAKVL